MNSFQPRKQKLSLNHIKQYSSTFSNTTAEINNDSSKTSAFDEILNDKGCNSDATYYPSSNTNSIKNKNKHKNIRQSNKLIIVIK